VDSKGGIYIAGEGQSDFPLLNPIPSQILQSTYYTIFASKIDPNNGPQFSLAPRVSPIFAFRNVSSAPLTIDSIVPSTNFTMGGNCGSSLAKFPAALVYCRMFRQKGCENTLFAGGCSGGCSRLSLVHDPAFRCSEFKLKKLSEALLRTGFAFSCITLRAGAQSESNR
jgi:hypothetical protein